MTTVQRLRAWPRDASGAIVPVFLAGGSNGRPHFDGTHHYMAGIMSDPRFEASISFTDDGWGARAMAQASAIGWMPGDARRLDAMADLYWRDAAIEVDRIKDGVTRRRLTGTIAEATISEGRVIITCADLSNRLDTAFATATFAGTGGIEGGSDAAGRLKRRSFGRVFDIEGRLLDKAHNIYEFGDPGYPLQGCVALRDKGRAGPLGIVAWQGSIALTLDALRASEPQEGGGVFAPSIACAKWWRQPSGPLAADLLGEALGYSENVVGIAAQMLLRVEGPAIVDQAAAEALRTGPAGIHVGGGETTAAALDRLLQRVSLLWGLSADGLVEIWPWTFAGPVASLQGTYIGRERSLKPVATRKVGFQKNERVHNDGEISEAVRASDVIYADGTTAAEAKEKLDGIEAGATNGMNDADAAAVSAQFDALGQSVLGEAILAGNWRGETDSALHDGTGTLIRTVVDEIGARGADHEAFIKFIRSVDAQNGNATFGMVSIVDGAIGGFLGLNDGEIVDLSFLIDIFRVIDRNGGDPIQVIEYDDGVLELNAEVRAKTLKVGAMDYEFTLNQTITATQGSQTLPGGVVMKWGQYRAAISDEVQLSIVFDEPFPTVCQSFVPVPYIATFSAFRDLWLQNVGAPTRLGASVGTQSSTSNNQQLDGFDWIAFGK